LIPNIRQGNGRSYGAGEKWTEKDLWVTLPTSVVGAVQDRFHELPSYVQNPRPIAKRASVIWCKATLVHRARDEDFGVANHQRYLGVALTSWTGYDLVPRNFFSTTPLYP
ncbi:MAG: hypothetical protein MI861_02625, partial [Pirellulales bacterium]|nr:hypothetical protein [Pirellulales bacterium]